ncbi:V-type ATP synthase subunit I [Deinococcus radiophilus]|uniref:V-type ATP synthase subunit I n=2 Tax=Deinococcus radiophilus TaxID=32062 RepID=A0A3S0L942_9DEIO|nr:V-type ATPase 116kDa subunit family protein [Deinococcus radiophilus]RTR29921.1 V-type ATP synthase subunit I [Deinococcus radiophilus]UFA51418.1 V-type ATP synthase subunit I [Deinococcus radiophilus]
MQQVVIAMRRRESEAVITALQEAGVVHLRPIEGGPLRSDSAQEQTSEELKEAERLLARVESTIAELGARRPADLAQASVPPRAEWAERIEAVAVPVAELARERTEVQADVDAASAYAEPVSALAGLVGSLDRSRRVAVIPFVLHAETDLAQVQAALKEALQDRYELAVQNTNTGRVGAVATLVAERDLARSALGRLRLGELRVPGRFEGMPLEQAGAELGQIRGAGRDYLQKLNARRSALAEQHGHELFAMRDGLKDLVAVHDVRTASARGRYSLVMQGYVPTDRISALDAALKPYGDAAMYEVHDVDAHHDAAIPVELRNSGYVRPYQMVMGLMSPPKYGTFDPTWVMAYLMPFLFGLIIGDVGYGILFFLVGLWLKGKADRGESWTVPLMGTKLMPNVLKDIWSIIATMSFWTVLWGFLTGEFFGTWGEHLGLFYFNEDLINRMWGWTGLEFHAHHALSGLIPITFPRLETEYFSPIMLMIALLFGIIQVPWGWFIRIREGLKHGDQTHVWEGIALFGGVIALILMAFITRAASNFGLMFDWANPLVWLMWLGFAAFVVGYLRVIRAFPMLPVELISQGGAVLSYARIFAVGLVSAIMAKLVADLGWNLYESMGIIGAIIGLALAVLLTVLILALTLIGHILQPIRLQMVEFLNPTGYNAETSPAYNPLRRLSPEQGR